MHVGVGQVKIPVIMPSRVVVKKTVQYKTLITDVERYLVREKAENIVHERINLGCE